MDYAMLQLSNPSSHITWIFKNERIDSSPRTDWYAIFGISMNNDKKGTLYFSTTQYKNLKQCGDNHVLLQLNYTRNSHVRLFSVTRECLANARHRSKYLRQFFWKMAILCKFLIPYGCDLKYDLKDSGAKCLCLTTRRGRIKIEESM